MCWEMETTMELGEAADTGAAVGVGVDREEAAVTEVIKATITMIRETNTTTSIRRNPTKIMPISTETKD